MRRYWRLTRLGWLAMIAAVAWVGATLLATPVQAAETPRQFYSNGKLLSSAHVPVTLWGEVKLKSKVYGEIACHDVMSASLWNEGGHGVGAMEGFTSTPNCNAPTVQELYEPIVCPLPVCKRATVFETAELPLEVEKREAEVCTERAKTELSQCPSSTERSAETLPLRIRRRSSLPWKLEARRDIIEEEEDTGLHVGEAPSSQTCDPKEVVEGVERYARWEAVPAGCLKIDVIVPQVPAELVFYGDLKPWFANGAGSGLDASHIQFGIEESGSALVSTTGEAETEGGGVVRLAGSEARELITAK